MRPERSVAVRRLSSATARTRAPWSKVKSRCRCASVMARGRDKASTALDRSQPSPAPRSWPATTASVFWTGRLRPAAGVPTRKFMKWSRQAYTESSYKRACSIFPTGFDGSDARGSWLRAIGRRCRGWVAPPEWSRLSGQTPPVGRVRRRDLAPSAPRVSRTLLTRCLSHTTLYRIIETPFSHHSVYPISAMAWK